MLVARLKNMIVFKMLLLELELVTVFNYVPQGLCSKEFVDFQNPPSETENGKDCAFPR